MVGLSLCGRVMMKSSSRARCGEGMSRGRRSCYGRGSGDGGYSGRRRSGDGISGRGGCIGGRICSGRCFGRSIVRAVIGSVVLASREEVDIVLGETMAGQQGSAIGELAYPTLLLAIVVTVHVGKRGARVKVLATDWKAGMDWIELTIAAVADTASHRMGYLRGCCPVMVLPVLALEGEAHARVLDSQVGEGFWRRAHIT